jgi:tetratricopeptide (TPR) repeat protein
MTLSGVDFWHGVNIMASRLPHSRPWMRPMMDRLALSILLLLAAAPALAVSDSEARLCSNAQLEPPLRVEACTRALALRDLTRQQHLLLLGARASALDELGDHARAIADFDSALVLAPDDAALHLNRGAAKIHDGRPADAIADYDAAIRLRPDWHLPYFNRAVALTDLGQRAAALKDYERAIRLEPDDAWIYVGQGDVLAASGDAMRAIESYDKALALRPELDDPRAKRADLLLRLDRPAEALPELDRVLAANPSKASLWRSRGEAKFQLARYADAAADLEQAHALAPQDGDVRRALARVYLGAGGAEAAWRTLSRDLDTTGDAADLTLAAMAAMLTERLSVADALARRAIALQPGNATAQAVLALALRRQGNAPRALDAAELAVAFAPNDAEIAAVAARAGAETSANQAPSPLPTNTPAQAARAACVADLRNGDLPAARAAGAAWSLCHLAAQSR